MKVSLYKQDDHFKELFDNVLKFDRHLKVSEVDAILESGQRAVNAFEKVDLAFEKVKETERRILHLFKGLGIRPFWFLTGDIPGELEYEVWYDDKDSVFIRKMRDLESETEQPNVIKIKMLAKGDEVSDDGH
ncbi:MAG: hypothetical protein ABI203_11060 [Mucilaginibacter sp.]